jgi:hypothetical protein
VADVDRLMQVDKLARLPQPVQELAEILFHINVLQETGRWLRAVSYWQRSSAAMPHNAGLSCYGA